MLGSTIMIARRKERKKRDWTGNGTERARMPKA